MTKTELTKEINNIRRDGNKISKINITITDFETENGYDVNVNIYFYDRFLVDGFENFTFAEGLEEEEAEKIGRQLTNYLENKGIKANYEGDEMA